MKDFLEFFGFSDDPFKITPDSRYFFLSESHQEALSSLRYLLESEEGFAVIIGEPGTGKTLTVRKFVDELPPGKVRFAYVLFPNLSPEELFEAILEDFGIRSEGVTKNKLFAKLRDFLISERKKGRKVLVIIDEAQNLPVETLEELRILSNLETSYTKLLQIILLGQPELEEKLSSTKLRQLRQRITVFVKLKNFTYEETKAYIDFRISKAGRGNFKIDPKTYRFVYRLSLGIPRLINILMERALMAAFVDSTHEVKPEHVERAAESIGLRIRREKMPRKMITRIAAASLILAGLVLLGSTLNKDAILDKFDELVYRLKPEEGGNTVYVSVPMLNMRETPDIKSDVIYVLREGERVDIIDEGPWPWIKVRLKREGMSIEGWINRKYVSGG